MNDKPNNNGIHTVDISELIPDERNANKGTARGMQALEDSIQECGAGRSILLDKNGKIIAGNKTHQKAGETGFTEVIVVPTDGTKLVAVQRTDLDLDTDPEARKLAYADNRVGQLDLDWDVETIIQDINEGIELTPYFYDEELQEIIGEKSEPEKVGVKNIPIKKPPAMTWVLIGIPTVRFSEINQSIEMIANMEDVLMEISVADENQYDENG